MRSFEKVNYALRPAKNVERKMMCEAFARLSAVAPLSEFRYVGFGAIAFVDFALVHQRLGVRQMLSIERAEDAKGRVLFNRPYSCITIKWGNSAEVLPTLSWRKRALVWLDYDQGLDGGILADIRTVTASVRSGSAFAVTVDAEPDGIDRTGNFAEQRLTKLRKAVGDDKVPRGTRGRELGKWGLARVCRDIIDNEITSTLARRNGPEPPARQLEYHQLFNFNYADGARMLTVGGYFANRRDLGRVPPERFKDLEFARDGHEPCLLEVPVLTWREARYLDARLPTLLGSTFHPSWLPQNDWAKYSKIYRHFPTYLEAEL
jgi:hypothetical protein